MTSSAHVQLEVVGRIWRLTLNRPHQGNACSASLVQGVDDALVAAQAEGAQVFVIRGEGRDFCTGFDLSRMDIETDDTLLARFIRIELMLQRLARAPFLTVACAQGRALGAGADLFAACELRLAHDDCTFAFPGARGFGLVLGTRRLAARVGDRTALAWVESGRPIATADAARHGLVHQIVQDAHAIDDLIAPQLHEYHGMRHSVRAAVAPQAGAEDARDLELLVRSAARAGLHGRISAYMTRVAAARRSSASPPALP